MLSIICLPHKNLSRSQWYLFFWSVGICGSAFFISTRYLSLITHPKGVPQTYKEIIISIISSFSFTPSKQSITWHLQFFSIFFPNSQRLVELMILTKWLFFFDDLLCSLTFLGHFQNLVHWFDWSRLDFGLSKDSILQALFNSNSHCFDMWRCFWCVYKCIFAKGQNCSKQGTRDNVAQMRNRRGLPEKLALNVNIKQTLFDKKIFNWNVIYLALRNWVKIV